MIHNDRRICHSVTFSKTKSCSFSVKLTLVNLSTITDVNRILASEAQDLYCSMFEETRKN